MSCVAGFYVDGLLVTPEAFAYPPMPAKVNPSRYGLDTLAVGESVTITYRVAPTKLRWRLDSHIRTLGKYRPAEYRVESVAGGMRVLRVA